MGRMANREPMRRRAKTAPAKAGLRYKYDVIVNKVTTNGGRAQFKAYFPGIGVRVLGG